jgi:hypothetical protein
MKRLMTLALCICAIAVLVSVGMASAANGPKGHGAAAKACAAQKKEDKAAFKATWGKHAMKNCIAATEDGAAT